MSAVQQARLKALKSSRWCARGLVIGAFVLSSVALGKLAADAHIPVYLAWIWPLCVDGAIYQATSAVMALGGRKEPEARAARRWFQRVIGGGVLVSVAANVLHAWTLLDHPLTWWQIAAIAVVPPILLMIATHGVTILAGLDVVDGLGDGLDELAESADQVDNAPDPRRITVERVEREPVAEAEQPRAIEQQPAIDRQAAADLEPVTAAHRKSVTTQRDPARVIRAKELAAAGEPVDVIAEQLEVSTRTVRRYLQVEITETTEAVERPQLFAVENRDRGLEVVNG